MSPRLYRLAAFSVRHSRPVLIARRGALGGLSQSLKGAAASVPGTGSRNVIGRY